MKKGTFKVGRVSRRSLSVERLQETRHDVILTKNKLHIVNSKTGEITSLRNDSGVFNMDMWIGCQRVGQSRKSVRVLHGRGASSQEITGLVIKETETKAISTFMVPNNGASEYLVKAEVDFMSGCGCRRARHKSDREPTIVALQGAVKNSRQNDTILENSSKGDS